MTNPARPPEPCCTGPFSDARECPVHDPRKSPPAAEADALARLRQENQRLRSLDDLRRRSNASVMDGLRRIATLIEFVVERRKEAEAALARVTAEWKDTMALLTVALDEAPSSVTDGISRLQLDLDVEHERAEAAERRAAQAVEALRSLVEQLDAVAADPGYVAVWTLYAAHGASYTGPFYIDELTAAKAALAAVRPESKPSTGARYDNNRSPYILRAAPL